MSRNKRHNQFEGLDRHSKGYLRILKALLTILALAFSFFALILLLVYLGDKTQATLVGALFSALFVFISIFQIRRVNRAQHKRVPMELKTVADTQDDDCMNVTST